MTAVKRNTEMYFLRILELEIQNEGIGRKKKERKVGQRFYSF